MISVANPIRIDSIDRDIQVRELTMGDIRALLKSREAIRDEDSEIDMLEILMIGEGLVLSDLTRLSDLTLSELEKLTEREVDSVVAAARHANPRFFSQVLAPISHLAQLAAAAKESSSSDPSSPSSEPDMPAPGTTH